MRLHPLAPDVKCPACGAGLVFVRRRLLADLYECASGGRADARFCTTGARKRRPVVTRSFTPGECSANGWRARGLNDVSRYYLTFADCRLACSQRVSRLLAAGRTATRQLEMSPSCHSRRLWHLPKRGKRLATCTVVLPSCGQCSARLRQGMARQH